MENNSQDKKIFAEWCDELSILNNPPKPASEQFEFSGEFGKTIPLFRSLPGMIIVFWFAKI